MSALPIPMTSTAHQATALKALAPAVTARRVCKTIDDRPILRDLSFEAPRGQFVSLLGANGAGKSTLLCVLATLTAPTAGELRIFGAQPRAGAADQRGRIGFIGHRPMLYRELTALENLIFFGRLFGVSNPRERARELLDYVGLAERCADPVGEFSRGMAQRVAIARALVHRPELLLADEPFAGLDAPSTRSIQTIFARLHEAGMTIMLANHDIPQSLALSQRVIALVRGRLAVDAPTGPGISAAALLEVISS